MRLVCLEMRKLICFTVHGSEIPFDLLTIKMCPIQNDYPQENVRLRILIRKKMSSQSSSDIFFIRTNSYRLGSFGGQILMDQDLCLEMFL